METRTLHIITANRLTDGLVVFRTGDARWSLTIAAAELLADEAAVEAALEKAFADAREPKKLVWLPRRLGHWGAYVGEGFDMVMAETLSWLGHWMPVEQ